MCLAVPARIEEMADSMATILSGGLKKEISLDILDENVDIGDYVVVHLGFALSKIDMVEVERTLKMLEAGGN